MILFFAKCSNAQLLQAKRVPMILPKISGNCANWTLRMCHSRSQLKSSLILESRMFVSRTVAAEVCMEAKANEVGYTALKQLDKSGDLRFELS